MWNVTWLQMLAVRSLPGLRSHWNMDICEHRMDTRFCTYQHPHQSNNKISSSVRAEVKTSPLLVASLDPVVEQHGPGLVFLQKDLQGSVTSLTAPQSPSSDRSLPCHSVLNCAFSPTLYQKNNACKKNWWAKAEHVLICTKVSITHGYTTANPYCHPQIHIMTPDRGNRTR